MVRVVLVAILLNLYSVNIFAQEDSPKRSSGSVDTLRTFLNDYVLGLRLKGGFSGTSVDNEFDFEFGKTILFSNLHTTDKGLTFSITQAIKHRNFPLRDGQRTGEEFNHDRVVVLGCEVGERTSTGKLMGFCRTIVDGNDDPTGAVFALRITEMEETRIVFEEDQVNYSDFSPTGRSSSPVAASTTRVLELDDENYLSSTATIRLYDVEPEYDAEIRGYRRTLRRQETINLFEVAQ